VGAVRGQQAPSFVGRLKRVGEAYRFAAACHAGQRRESDDAAFIVHPAEVGALLDGIGSPEHVIVAGVLHDVLEKTAATPEEVRRRFGGQVAGLVLALTEDPTIEPFEARKAALTAQIMAAGPLAGAISAADKVAKVRELRSRLRQARSRGEADPWDAGRKRSHYIASFEALRRQIPGHPLVARLGVELESLDALAPVALPVAGLSVAGPDGGVR
jgi:hypothetical protein